MFDQQTVARSQDCKHDQIDLIDSIVNLPAEPVLALDGPEQALFFPDIARLDDAVTNAAVPGKSAVLFAGVNGTEANAIVVARYFDAALFCLK